jgi:hypothetical protein
VQGGRNRERGSFGGLRHSVAIAMAQTMILQQLVPCPAGFAKAATPNNKIVNGLEYAIYN